MELLETKKNPRVQVQPALSRQSASLASPSRSDLTRLSHPLARLSGSEGRNFPHLTERPVMRFSRQEVLASFVLLQCLTRSPGSPWSPSSRTTFVTAGLSSNRHLPRRKKTNRSLQVKTGAARRTKKRSRPRKSHRKKLRRSLNQQQLQLNQPLPMTKMTSTRLLRILMTTVKQLQLSRRRTRRQKQPRRRQLLSQNL